MARSVPAFTGHVKHLQVLLEACRAYDPALWSSFCAAQGSQFSADLRGADLREKNLAGFMLRRARLQGADFSGANLSGTDLTDSHLAGAHFDGAVLQGAKLPRPRIKASQTHEGFAEGPSRHLKADQIQRTVRILLDERRAKEDEQRLRREFRNQIFRIEDDGEE